MSQPRLFTLPADVRLLAPEWIGTAAGLRAEDVREMPWAYRFDLSGPGAEERQTVRILRACWEAWSVSDRPLDIADQLRAQRTGPAHADVAVALAIPSGRSRFRASELADAWSLTPRHVARLVQRGELKPEIGSRAGESAVIARAEIEIFLHKRIIQ